MAILLNPVKSWFLVSGEFGRSSIYAPAAFSKFVVAYNNTASGAALDGGSLTSPLCMKIRPGVVVVSDSQGVGVKVRGSQFFQRMSSTPMIFSINVDPLFMVPYYGVCSLSVSWSC